MSCTPSTRARWHAHVNGVNPPAPLRPWLADPSSLTERLMAACGHFRVRLIRQVCGLGGVEECKSIGLPRRSRIWQREVLLHCDGEPVVFARTVAPCATLAAWRWLHRLGERSLGTALFADPRVSRGELQFARLQPAHPLRRALLPALERDYAHNVLYARRSKFAGRQGCLLVTEVFLPSISRL